MQRLFATHFVSRSTRKEMNRLLLLIAFVVAPAAIVVGEEKSAPLYTGKVSALAIPASELGEGWTGPTGLVVDDFADVGKYPADVQDLVEALKTQVSAIGVVATADFTYQRKLNPLQQVTVRVFVFDSEKSCRDWWQKKYQYEGWDKHYSVVPGDKHAAVDSKEMPKRAVAIDNVWLTSGTIGESKDHVKALDLYSKKIESATTK
jgi:hypothetical protein